MSTLKFAKVHNMVAFLEKPTESEGFKQVIDFLNASCLHYALTVNPTVYVSHITQFWTTAQVKKVNGVTEIQALVDGKPIVVFEASIRRILKFNNEGGMDCLPNATIFEEIARMRYEKLSQKLTFYKAFFSPQWKFLIHTFLQCISAKTTAWNEFSSIAASAIICLSTNQKFNFSKFILEGMIQNLDAKAIKFLMYPRFVQLFVNQLEGLPMHHRQYKVPCHTKKFFANMKRKNAAFSGTITPLFPIMVVQPPSSPPPTTSTTPTPIPTPSAPTITTPPPTTTPPTTSSPQASILTQPTTSIPSTQPSKQRVRRSKDTQVTQPSVPIMVDVSVPNESNDPPSGEDRLKLNELMDLCTTLQAKVLDLKKTKASQQLNIESLEKRVKKLEKDKKKRTYKLKRLYKGRSIADIDEDAEVTLVQGRRDEGHEEMFDAELDLVGEEIVVEEVRNEEVMVENVAEKFVEKDVAEIALNEDEIILAQTFQKLKNTPKAKGVTPKAKSISIREPSESHRAKIPKKNLDKGKGKMVEPEKPLKRKQQILLDEEEARRLQAIFDEEARLAKEEADKEAQLVEDWDNVKAKVDTDYELASKLQAEERQELSIEEKSKLFVELMEKRKRHFAAKRAEEKRNKPPTKAQKRKTMSTYLKNMDGMDSAEEVKKLEGTSKRASDEPKSKSRKKPKMDDEEIAKLQALIEITPVEEEVPINAIPLAMKPPVIVDFSIHKEGRVGFYKITRADGLDTIFRVFSVLLYSFDREDLETLWKLVKARHGDTRP
ncbi:hypothetical protein Tco_0242503 [Tanacetum coccineum]